MKNLLLPFVLSVAFSINSCNTISEIKLQSKSSFEQNSSKVIPFQYVKQLIVIHGKINHSGKDYSFIFDTGAFQSKIEYDLADSLNLKTVSKRDNGTAQGIKRELEITNIESLKLSNSIFKNIGAGKLKYDPMSYSPCVAPDGIIGANLIKLGHWKINYSKNEIEVSKTPFEINTQYQFFPLDFSTSFLSGIPKIDVQIEGHIIKDVVFDLGYNGGLVVPYSYAEKFTSSETLTLIDQSTAGIFGSNRDTLLVKILNIKLGEFQTKIPVEFSSLNKALLGNDVLEHFTVFLNYDKKSIMLVPTSNVSVDTPLKFIPAILNDSLWVVNRTNPNLSLEIGDTLKSINGYQPKSLFKTHCDYFFEISSVLNADSLLVETINGKNITIFL